VGPHNDGPTSRKLPYRPLRCHACMCDAATAMIRSPAFCVPNRGTGTDTGDGRRMDGGAESIERTGNFLSVTGWVGG